MVELGNASVAYPAMFGPVRPHNSARVTQPQDVLRGSLTLPLVVVGYLFDGPLVFAGVPGQEARISPIGHDQAHPHHHVHDQEGVVSLRKDLPSNGNALQT